MRFFALGGPRAIDRHVGDVLIWARLGVRIQDRQPVGAPSSDRHVECPRRGRERHRLQLRSDRG
jgi:hypothetical protein